MTRRATSGYFLPAAQGGMNAQRRKVAQKSDWRGHDALTILPIRETTVLI